MYGVIIQVKLDRDCQDEMTVIMEDEVVPRARQLAGFAGGSWFRSLKGDQATAVMLFGSEEDACRVAELVTHGPLMQRRVWSVHAIGTYEVLAQA